LGSGEAFGRIGGDWRKPMTDADFRAAYSAAKQCRRLQFIVFHRAPMCSHLHDMERRISSCIRKIRAESAQKRSGSMRNVALHHGVSATPQRGFRGKIVRNK
jgi:hypothetical protein